jgi:hypothetical protein
MVMYINLPGDWSGHRSSELNTIQDERVGEIQTWTEERIVANKIYVTDCNGMNIESSGWNIYAFGTPLGEQPFQP